MEKRGQVWDSIFWVLLAIAALGVIFLIYSVISGKEIALFSGLKSWLKCLVGGCR